MVSTPEDVSKNIATKLSITAPNLSLEIGSPERKIIDAVGEAIAESQIDTYTISSQMDIDTKSGVDLEAFVGIWGFGRLSGKKSTGEVRFSLAAPAVQPIIIPQGTRVYVPSPYTNIDPLYFITVVPASITVGQQEVYVAAECTVASVRGNVTANSIIGSTISSGVVSVTNPIPFIGGVDPESDEALRTRFKQTFLRNIAGTYDFYRALALQAESTSKVKILGPIERSREQLQSVGTGSVPSQRNDIKYTWPDGWFIANNRGMDTEQFFEPVTDFIINRTVTPPEVQPQSDWLKTAGNVYDFEYEFCSIFSRNDPLNGITNKVDMYINGVEAIDVAEQTVITSEIFSASSSNRLWTGNFRREDTDAPPSSGARFQRLGSVPIVSFPSHIIIGDTTYLLGTDYVGVHDTTIMRGTEREISGIQWLVTPPLAGTAVTIEYSYNRLPEVMNAIVRNKRQITTDMLVHEAMYGLFEVNIVVMYDSNAAVEATDSKITTALSNLLASYDFGSWIQMSDITQTVHNVPGVDNVRMTKQSENGTQYGIQRMSNNGTAVVTSHPTDFRLNDNELPVLAQVHITRKSFNTFGG